MTQLSSLRGGISRGEYQVQSAKVAGAIAQRLLTGRSLRLAGQTTESQPGRGSRRRAS